MALLMVNKAVLGVKLVARVFLSNKICLLVVALQNQGAAMALLRVTKVLLWVKLVARAFLWNIMSPGGRYG